jgi:hypothetical protein
MGLRSNHNFAHVVLYQSAEELSNKSLMLQQTEKKELCNIKLEIKTTFNTVKFIEVCIQ